jgi:hypothetical protein
MNRPTWLAAIVLVLAPTTGFAQFGGMGGMGGAGGGMGGQGMGGGMMMGTRMMPAGPVEVRRNAQVEMEGGHRLSGWMDLRTFTVDADLGSYAIQPDKIKMIRFLKPAAGEADQAADVPADANARQIRANAAMVRGFRNANQQMAAMMGQMANPSMSATMARGKVVTTSGEEIVGNIYIPADFKLEFDYGSLTLTASKLRSITFVAPDRKAEAAKADAAAPRYFRQDHCVIAVSADGERVTFHDIETGRSQSVELSGSKAAPIDVTPIRGSDLVALALEGPKIRRVAVADLASGTWHPQELREPVEGRVRPIVAPGLAVYNLGRYVYAYSAAARRWGVVELPEGLRGGAVVGPGGVTVEGHGQIYTFLPKTGQWEHVDVRAILDGTGAEGKK